MSFARTPPRLPNVDYRQIRTFLVTFCVARRRPAFADPVLASIACACIQRFRDAGSYWLYAYVVMHDHVHIILRPQTAGTHLSRTVAIVKSAILVEVRRYLREFQWQRGYHELIAREGEDLKAMVDYVLENPQRAGLVSGESRYPYSGAVDRWR